ncbi:fluoride efflux transporter CrcB [Hyphococcus luteus]|uniref:Fluoride-specific ion channel FluC n=1 Tax=Hyphococcus luteus TaxID=2058213 RepID=A0A2S7JYW9_9PROT|nr:fluoride efflux transporter CrcB [Marinicaulis flavus]PQA85406.1 fluoride efflux transporter CrcB [Marinicaulis flavus]
MGAHIWMAVAAGGAVGAVGRNAVSRAAMHFLGPNFPWGTLAVNVLGSFAMGFFIVWLAHREPASPALRAFLTVGLLGAFTTFSTFSLDAVTLYRDRTLMVAGVYVLASVILSVGGLFAGLAAGRQVL